MDPRHRRPPSPGSRRLNNPMRASTGTMSFSPPNDYYPGTRGSTEFYSSRPSKPDIRDAGLTTRPHATNPDVIQFAHPRRPRRTSSELVEVGDLPGRPNNRAIRGRSRSISPDSRPTYRRPARRASLSADGNPRLPPVTIIPGTPRSPQTSRPIIHGGLGERRVSPNTADYDRFNDGDYYVTPASSGRRRENRRYYPVDNRGFSRLAPSADGTDRGARSTSRDQEMDPTRYGSSPSGPAARRGYHLSGPLVRNPDTDRNAYTYASRDRRDPGYPVQARRPRGSSFDNVRRERPISMAGMDEYLPPVKESGPPPTNRGFEPMGRSRSMSQGHDGRAYQPSSSYTTPNPFEGLLPIPKNTRPVSIVQAPMPGAFPATDDDDHGGRGYDGEVDRFGYGIRGEPRSRDVDDRDRRDPRERGDGVHERKVSGQSRDIYDERGERYDDCDDRDLRERREAAERRERRSEPDAREAAREARDRRDAQDAREQRIERELRERREEIRDERREERELRENSRDNGRTSGPILTGIPGLSNGNKNRSAPAPIRGILREPREHFPEHPPSVREGVLPLKDKDPERLGIPADARWTRISRRLVNPAALEGRERFEEKEDHVIVLRVLTPDEIEAYAERTDRIREARANRDRERRRSSQQKPPTRRETIEAPPRRSPPTLTQSSQPTSSSQQPQIISAAPGTRAVIVDSPKSQSQSQSQPAPPPRASTLPVTITTASSSNRVERTLPGGLRPNPDAPGTYLGYRRNPPPVVTTANARPVAAQRGGYWMSGGLGGK